MGCCTSCIIAHPSHEFSPKDKVTGVVFERWKCINCEIYPNDPISYKNCSETIKSKDSRIAIRVEKKRVEMMRLRHSGGDRLDIYTNGEIYYNVAAK
jgi:hypothetical protein